MTAWHNISDRTDGEEAGSDSLKTFLAAAKNYPTTLRKPETVTYISVAIGQQLMNLLLKSGDDVGITLLSTQLGLGSLLGIEMRSWWRQTFGFDISVIQLLGLGTERKLGRQAADGLLKASEG